MKTLHYLVMVLWGFFGFPQTTIAQNTPTPSVSCTISACTHQSTTCPIYAATCQGKTYTQGGWGNTNGTPGVYLNTNFSTYFPNGISIGCTDRLIFTNATAVRNFLPSGSTPTCLPSGTLTNPATYNNVLASQILALTLNAYFDAYDPNFSPASTPLLNQTIASGTFSGMTVGAFLSIANSVLGGCSTTYPYSVINQVATALNENYDNGNSDRGYLMCPPVCNLSVTASSGIIPCYGQTTTVTITAAGATSPYTGTGTYTRSAGTYSFPVNSANGCSTTAIVTLTQPAIFSPSIANGAIACFGGNTSIQVTASGGTAPYQGTGQFIRSTGVHTFTVSDSRLCSATVSTSLSQPTSLSLTTTAGSITCNGELTTASILASGGTAPYTGTGIYTLSAGPYSYTITDANACSSVVSGTITQPSALTASAVTGSISGFGLTTTIAISATGGTQPYTGTGTYSLPAGPYSYTISDANGCTALVTGTLTQPALLLAASVHNSVLCYGGTATVAVNASGGVAPYAGTGTYTVTAGPYSYTVTDVNGNTAVTTGTVLQPTALSLTAISGSINCNGASTLVNLSANGGTAPYTLSGSNINGNTALNNGVGTYSVLAGPYSYTITDANACSSMVSGTITQPTALTASAVTGSISGFGLTTTIAISATGGTQPYTGTGTYSLPAGPYSYTISDANGCTAMVTGTLTQPALLLAASVHNSVLCYGGTATIAVNASGGVAPYAGTGTYTVTAGPYSYTVTDANGNTAVTTGTVLQPTALSLTAISGSINCNGASTLVNLSANGGTAPYTLSGSNINGNTALNNGVGTYSVLAGPYSYTITDANACSSVVSGTITQPTALTASAVTGSISGFGLTTTIAISATGGTQPYTGTGTYSLPAGPYSYTISDANGCTAMVTGTLTQPALLLAASVHNSVLCYGGTATVAVSASGGVAPYAGTGTYTVTAGPYSYTVTDANGNTAVTTGTVLQPTALSLTAISGSINCNGASTLVNLSANGGTAPYTLSGSNINGNTALNNGVGTYSVLAGPYSYTITDANACSSMVSGTITQPTALTASAVTGSISGFGLTTTIAISATGGTQPYTGTGTYSLPAGPYSYTISDANGCTAMVTGTLTQPALLLAASVHNSVLCYGGTATVAVSASGGVAPYAGTGTYTVTAGPYSYTVTDANGNTAVTTGTVLQPTALSLTAISGSINCNGASTLVNLSANGGTAPYTLSGSNINGNTALNNGVGTYSVLAGPYSYTITDANACSSVVSGTITQPSALTASAVTAAMSFSNTVTSLTITAAGGTPNYNGTGQFTVTAGPYTFTVTDANGCQAILSGTIAPPAPLSIAATHNSITCYGGSATLAISATGGTGPYTGFGVTGSGTISTVTVGSTYSQPAIYTVSAGPYTFTVTDVLGNVATVTGTITGPSSALSTSVTAGTISCHAGTTTLSISASGGTPPYVNSGLHTVSAGPYAFQISDTNGCLSIVTGTLTEPTEFMINVSSASVACFGATVNAVVSGSGGIQPYSGIGTIMTTGGSHTYSASDANGCQSVANYSVSQPPQLQLLYMADSIACFGGYSNATLTATGGTGPIYGNTGIFPVYSGTNIFFAEDANGCQANAIILVGEPTELNVSLITPPILCYGDIKTGTVVATGGTSPYVGTGTLAISGGIYTVTVSDAAGCIKTDTIQVNQPLPLVLETCGHIRCAGDSARVVITGTGGVAPYAGTGTVTLGPGNYTLNISDTNSCVASKTISLVDPLPLTVSSVVTPILCHGDSAIAVVTATGGVAPYFGAGTYTVAAGTYTYGVIDSLFCIDTAVAYITQPPQLLPTAQLGVLPCLNSETTITVTATGGTQPYTGTGTFATGPGTYTYAVQDTNGCNAFVVLDVDTSVCLGFENLNADQVYSTLVYPNPSTGKFTIRTLQTGKAQLISESGQLIRIIQLESDKAIDVEDLAKGLYFLITTQERIKIAVTSE